MENPRKQTSPSQDKTTDPRTRYRSQVLSSLVEYPLKLKQIELLRYEMAHPAYATEEEILDAMCFSRPDCSSAGASGTLTDKTAHIAETYRCNLETLNQELFDEIRSQLLQLEQEVERLRFYVGLLGDNEEKIIRLVYFEQHSLKEAAETMGLSPWVARRVREAGIKRLTEMFAFIHGGVSLTN